MSRIAGIYSEDGGNAKYVETMLEAVAHSNPWTPETIIGNSSTVGYTGSRSRVFRSEKVSVVMDGDIYNAEELAPGLDATALVVNLFLSIGFEEAVRKCNGDFAIALVDHRDNSLWIARDRIGIKPLYYSVYREGLAFASRIKSILQLPDMDTTPDAEFVARFSGLHYRYIDNSPDQSPIAAIRQLPAAHILHFCQGRLDIKRYWSLEDLPDWEESQEVLAAKYRELFLDAVRIRLRAAKKPGFTLSGGMDSSSVLAGSTHILGEKQNALSTVYVDKTYDETDEIVSMLDQHVSQWHKIEIGTPDVLSDIEKMIDIHDEPVVTATWLSHYHLCQYTKDKGFESLFGGLGGDELNAGEYEYFFFHFADLVQSNKREQFVAEVEKWVEYHDHPVFKKNLQVAEDALKHMVDLNQPGVCRPEKTRMMRYADAINTEYFDLHAYQPNMDHVFGSYLKNRTYQDIFYETAPCCLRAEDRQTMAYGIENYLPFFDYRLVEFMYRVPGHMKIYNGVTKILLREAMKGILPEETRMRIKKTGWNAPAHQWFMGEGLDKLADLVHSQKFRQRGIFNTKVIDNLMEEHRDIIQNNRVADNHMMFFWQLVNLELWIDQLSQIKTSQLAGK